MNWSAATEAFGFKSWTGLSSLEYLKTTPDGVAKDAAIFVLARLLFLVSESGVRISAADLSVEWKNVLGQKTVSDLGENAFSRIQKAQTWFAERASDPTRLTEAWPEISTLSTGGEPAAEVPIFISPSGHFYLHRSFLAEHRLISAINRLMPRGTKIHRADEIAKTMARDLAHSPTPLHLNAEQIQAVSLAGAAPLTLLTGGPGTGKTTTVVNFLRALRLREPKLRIALAAPTGRAAVRLGESVAKEIRLHPWKPEVDSGLSLAGQTLHSLLGVNDFSPPTFHRLSPLPIDFLVVDEATMADLRLLAITLEALSENARILLVGDPAQLPSVETGSVFADLLPDDEGHRFANVSTELVESHRHKSCPNLQALASAIQNRSPETILKKILGEAKSPSSVEAATALGHKDLIWFDADESNLDNILKKLFPFESLANVERVDAGNPESLLEIHAANILLTPGYAGKWGIRAVNRRCRELLARQWEKVEGKPARIGLQIRRGEWIPGESVLMTASRKELGLANGDRGVVVWDPRAEELEAVFHVAGNRIRSFPISRLGELQPGWALTIHKSQGSEFENVALLLPAAAERLQSREIVYTGLTRASRSCLIACEEATFLASVKRGVRRDSGIPAAMGE